MRSRRKYLAPRMNNDTPEKPGNAAVREADPSEDRLGDNNEATASSHISGSVVSSASLGQRGSGSFMDRSSNNTRKNFRRGPGNHRKRHDASQSYRDKPPPYSPPKYALMPMPEAMPPPYPPYPGYSNCYGYMPPYANARLDGRPSVGTYNQAAMAFPSMNQGHRQRHPPLGLGYGMGVPASDRAVATNFTPRHNNNYKRSFSRSSPQFSTPTDPQRDGGNMWCDPVNCTFIPQCLDPYKVNTELVQVLERHGTFETDEEIRQRHHVLDEVSSIVKTWIKDTAQKQLGEKQAACVAGKVLAIGSYRLEVQPKGADMDLLIVAPMCVRRIDFNSVLLTYLNQHAKVRNLRALPDAYVPLIKMDFAGTQVDILFARLPQMLHVPDDLLTLAPGLLQQLDERCVRSLNGCRVTDEILQLVPDAQQFRLALRSIRLWAKISGIYANIVGFLGGISWAILVAKVCQMYPHTMAAELVHQFFALYSNWNWPEPIRLTEPDSIANAHGSAHLHIWEPRLNASDRFHFMPIILPSYPQQNSSYNVSMSNFKVMLRLFKEGYYLTRDILSGEATWEEFFSRPPFFHKYEHFLMVTVAAANRPNLNEWSSLVLSRLRHLLVTLDRCDKFSYVHIDPKPVCATYVHPNNIGERLPIMIWFIGVQISDSCKEAVINISDIVQAFLVSVFNQAQYVHMLMHGMNLSVMHLCTHEIKQLVVPPYLLEEELEYVKWRQMREHELNSDEFSAEFEQKLKLMQETLPRPAMRLAAQTAPHINRFCREHHMKNVRIFTGQDMPWLLIPGTISHQYAAKCSHYPDQHHHQANSSSKVDLLDSDETVYSSSMESDYVQSQGIDCYEKEHKPKSQVQLPVYDVTEDLDNIEKRNSDIRKTECIKTEVQISEESFVEQVDHLIEKIEKPYNENVSTAAIHRTSSLAGTGEPCCEDKSVAPAIMESMPIARNDGVISSDRSLIVESSNISPNIAAPSCYYQQYYSHEFVSNVAIYPPWCTNAVPLPQNMKSDNSQMLPLQQNTVDSYPRVVAIPSPNLANAEMQAMPSGTGLLRANVVSSQTTIIPGANVQLYSYVLPSNVAEVLPNGVFSTFIPVQPSCPSGTNGSILDNGDNSQPQLAWGKQDTKFMAAGFHTPSQVTLSPSTAGTLSCDIANELHNQSGYANSQSSSTGTAKDNAARLLECGENKSDHHDATFKSINLTVSEYTKGSELSNELLKKELAEDLPNNFSSTNLDQAGVNTNTMDKPSPQQSEISSCQSSQAVNVPTIEEINERDKAIADCHMPDSIYYNKQSVQMNKCATVPDPSMVCYCQTPNFSYYIASDMLQPPHQAHFASNDNYIGHLRCDNQLGIPTGFHEWSNMTDHTNVETDHKKLIRNGNPATLESSAKQSMGDRSMGDHFKGPRLAPSYYQQSCSNSALVYPYSIQPSLHRIKHSSNINNESMNYYGNIGASTSYRNQSHGRLRGKKISQSASSPSVRAYHPPESHWRMKSEAAQHYPAKYCSSGIQRLGVHGRSVRKHDVIYRPRRPQAPNSCVYSNYITRIGDDIVASDFANRVENVFHRSSSSYDNGSEKELASGDMRINTQEEGNMHDKKVDLVPFEDSIECQNLNLPICKYDKVDKLSPPINANDAKAGEPSKTFISEICNATSTKHNNIEKNTENNIERDIIKQEAKLKKPTVMVNKEKQCQEISKPALSTVSVEIQTEIVTSFDGCTTANKVKQQKETCGTRKGTNTGTNKITKSKNADSSQVGYNSGSYKSVSTSATSVRGDRINCSSANGNRRPLNDSNTKRKQRRRYARNKGKTAATNNIQPK